MVRGDTLRNFLKFSARVVSAVCLVLVLPAENLRGRQFRISTAKSGRLLVACALIVRGGLFIAKGAAREK